MKRSSGYEQVTRLNRRIFLRRGAEAGVAAVAICRGGINILRAAASDTPDAGDLEEATIAGLQEMMRAGKLSARVLADEYLKRIEKLDKRGPALNSVIEINPDAESIAADLDRERKSGRPRGPLHGIPVLIKDNIDTADRMLTTAGSLALVGAKPLRDAFIVRRLREAGAVILGKTNLSEWANFRSTHSTSGWSGRGGLTRNPYAIERNPCGSSSGSGVAVAANLCAVAVGTETDGSIVCPSSANSLVGFKPTLGLVSRSGIIPIAHSQDTAGPMARNVADAAILLGVLAGFDPLDAVTAGGRGRAADYTRFLDPRGLRGARVGVARKFFGFNERVDKLLNEAIEVMKRQGAVLVDPADIPTMGKFDASEFEVLLYEFKADLNKYLAGLGPDAPVRTLKEIIEFNEKNREREMPYFGQEILLMAEKKGPLTSRAYRQALAKNHRLARAEGIDAVMRRHRLDAIVAPTGGPPWMTDLINGDHFSGGSSTPAAVAGYPNITVPAGYVFDLPVGISFFGAAYTEPKLFKLAYAFEQATKLRQPPKISG
ncbi:MAG: amidase [Pyrinomonadaceae bacterium]